MNIFCTERARPWKKIWDPAETPTQDLLNTSQTLLPLSHLDPWQRSRRQATQAALPRGLSRTPTWLWLLGLARRTTVCLDFGLGLSPVLREWESLLLLVCTICILLLFCHKTITCIWCQGFQWYIWVLIELFILPLLFLCFFHCWTQLWESLYNHPYILVPSTRHMLEFFTRS